MPFRVCVLWLYWVLQGSCSRHLLWRSWTFNFRAYKRWYVSWLYLSCGGFTYGDIVSRGHLVSLELANDFFCMSWITTPMFSSLIVVSISWYQSLVELRNKLHVVNEWMTIRIALICDIYLQTRGFFEKLLLPYRRSIPHSWSLLVTSRCESKYNTKKLPHFMFVE